MSLPEDASEPDLFVKQLAAFDEALAGGTPPPSSPTPETDLDRRLEEAQECLLLLEYAWPRTALSAPLGSAPGTPIWLAPGPLTAFGRFELRRELGRGGQGVVYHAYDPRLKRDVAVKVPRPEVLVTEDLRRRFRREAEAAARLDHPNLVAIYEVGEVGPVCYLVSAYCPGPSLAAWLRTRSQPLPPQDVARFVAALAEAVAFMHSQGVLHRDIKPGNILLCEAASPVAPAEASSTRAEFSPACLAECEPKLTDFGLAKLTEGLTGPTRTGAVLGTPAYMAPEQADGRWGPISPATDVYALGVLLYELLTGKPPFLGSTDVDTVRQLLAEEPRSLTGIRADLPRDLTTICLKCLEKEPARRYGSARALHSDLAAFLAGMPIAARPARPTERAVKWARRRPAVAALSATLAAALFSLVLWATWYGLALREHNAALQAALDRAEAGERRLHAENYAIQIKLADSLQADDPAGLLGETLKTLRPAAGLEDLRGFEWYHLWRVARRELRLRGHHSDVNTAAFSPDGRMCASGADDGEICLWNVARTNLLATLRGHTTWVRNLHFTADGRYLVSAASRDWKHQGEMIVWDLETRRELARLGAHGDLHLRQPLLSADGERIAFAKFQGRESGPEGQTSWQLGLWDWRENRVTMLEPAGLRWMMSLWFASSGRSLTALTFLNQLVTWDLVSGQYHIVEGFSKTEFLHAAASPDGSTLVTEDANHSLSIRDVATKQSRLLRASGGTSQNPVTGQFPQFRPDGRLLAIKTNFQRAEPFHSTITLWDWPSGTRRPEELRTVFSAFGLAFSPDQETIAVACGDRHVHLWRPFDAGAAATLKVRGTKEAWAVAFAPDSQTLAVGYDDEAGFDRETLKLWDLRTRREMATLSGHKAMVTGAAFRPDGATLVTAGYDSQIKMWDARTGRLRSTLRGESKEIRCLASSANSHLVATGGMDKVVRLWDLAAERECWASENLDDICHAIAITPDGQTVAAASNEGRLYFWDVQTGSCLRMIQRPGSFFSLAYSPEGRYLASGNRDGIIQLQDLQSAEEPRSFLGHRGEARALAFTPDGKTLASGGEDRTVRLWQVSTGRELIVFKDLPQKVNALAFAPDGETLAAALHDGGVRLWYAPRGE